MLLAFEVQRAITRGLDASDRGVRRAGFEVLRKAPMPAILIENGFMSNGGESRKIFDEDIGKKSREPSSMASSPTNASWNEPPSKNECFSPPDFLRLRASEFRATTTPRAHAHNDYEHTHPLFDALDQGFGSIEPDIYLVNGDLLVAHNRADCRPERNLVKLYSRRQSKNVSMRTKKSSPASKR